MEQNQLSWEVSSSSPPAHRSWKICLQPPQRQPEDVTVISEPIKQSSFAHLRGIIDGRSYLDAPDRGRRPSVWSCTRTCVTIPSYGRSSYSQEWTYHSWEWTCHSWEWTVHSQEWTCHSWEWTCHSHKAVLTRTPAREVTRVDFILMHRTGVDDSGQVLQRPGCRGVPQRLLGDFLR